LICNSCFRPILIDLAAAVKKIGGAKMGKLMEDGGIYERHPNIIDDVNIV
jgi:hypothetical protein